MRKWIAATLVLTVLLLCGCHDSGSPSQKVWTAGFGMVQLPLPEDTDEPLYIAGYHNGWEITGVLDLQQVRALWLDDGETAMLLIAVDCIGLSSGTVEKIRSKLSDFCRQTDCDYINVVTTHTHAGVDTLGLWGPVGMDGKNEGFMSILIDGVVSAAKAAYADRCIGMLSYAVSKTENLQEDSRKPETYDSSMYQIRFVPNDPNQNGIRLISFAAHAEALRGDNTMVSRDYPGVVCDIVKAQTGEEAIFLPGAIGGLILTPKFCGEPFDAVKNLRSTGFAIAECVLNARNWRPLEANMAISRVEFETPLENTLFLYYKFLGILDNDVRQNLLGTYYLQSELSVIQLDGFAMVLLPGEIFPELVTGTGSDADPEPIVDIMSRYGIDHFMIAGLANDEIGYIVPPSDYALDPHAPFFREAEGDHYEETNSVGYRCAEDIVTALDNALKDLSPN